MYKIFGFNESETFGRVALVEFSFPYDEESYAYLLGNFNAFNEGSFRMELDGNRWKIVMELPEGIWRYAFSAGGEFILDPENPEREVYRGPSYKFEREVSLARIVGEGTIFHSPSLLYLYSFAGRTYVLLRTKKRQVSEVFLHVDGREIRMRRKATGEVFEYYEVVLPGEEEVRYSFEVFLTDGGTLTLGPFDAVPFKLDTPSWVLNRVFYQIMPDRFAVGFEKENLTPGENFHGGDLVGLMERLNHLEKLGVNALYLTPIFESMTYHGYDITDYFKVAERFGGNEAFEGLVKFLKEKDIRLILDGVFHHTSFFHPFFQDIVERGMESPYADFYRVKGFPVVSEEFLTSLRTPLPWIEKYHLLKKLGWNYESFFSVWLMPRLNHDSPKVKEFVVGVMGHWLEKGADGWRLDVAHGVPPGFWKEVREKLPDEAYLFGEVMDDPRLYLFDVFHGTMNYPLYDLLLRFFASGKISAPEFINGLELLSARLGPAEYFTYNFLDNHDTERFIDLAGKRRYLCALTFLMTYKGVPAIFYGDEIGLRGSEGGMSAGRTPMPWNEEDWDSEILKKTGELIHLRRSSAALQMGDFSLVGAGNEWFAYERDLNGERVLVVINCSGREVKLHWTPLDIEVEVAPVSGVVVYKDVIRV
ncbi:glycoside hydrolase family 13 protein [Thermococcus sp. Bubb.Bath]|uniref:alpha amylase N-terminal ig-like domain-containing protein n=1 Tax=Thermococcus sp. Bubb.Bath TaxID=1638242 RepID=UPI00143B0768|nr:glycoside hydrolase family 13 protein [Thermococcus sp. Bubb.Bath]